MLSAIFIALAISNLNSTERDAYQAMYDANNELYEAYIDTADKYEQYGYSSKAETYRSKAYALDEKLEGYKSELTGLNVQMGIYVVLALASVAGAVCLFVKKVNLNLLTETENNLNTKDGETI